MTAEELSETYSSLSTKELLDIIDNKFDYTELAVAVALSELSKRNLSEQDIKEYKDDKLEEAKEFIKKNFIDDLNVVQKTLFFFIWFPLFTFPFRQNLRDDGFVLKLKQARYYSWCGFIFMIVSDTAAKILDSSTAGFLALWVLGFILTLV